MTARTYKLVATGREVSINTSPMGHNSLNIEGAEYGVAILGPIQTAWYVANHFEYNRTIRKNAMAFIMERTRLFPNEIQEFLGIAYAEDVIRRNHRETLTKHRSELTNDEWINTYRSQTSQKMEEIALDWKKRAEAADSAKKQTREHAAKEIERLESRLEALCDLVTEDLMTEADASGNWHWSAGLVQWYRARKQQKYDWMEDILDGMLEDDRAKFVAAIKKGEVA